MNALWIAAMATNAAAITLSLFSLYRVLKANARSRSAVRDMHVTLTAAEEELHVALDAKNAEWRARHIAESDARIAAMERKA